MSDKSIQIMLIIYTIIFSVIFSLFLVYGEYNSNNINEYKQVKTIIINNDSCEYIINNDTLIHDINCKFCRKKFNNRTLNKMLLGIDGLE